MNNMRLPPLPVSEYEGRIARLQAELERAGLDVFVGYSSESESAASRYLAGFWPFFDFCSVVVPVKGKAALVTGGPESFEFASRFARAVEIRVNPLLVETSPPEWVPEVKGESFRTLLPVDLRLDAPQDRRRRMEHLSPRRSSRTCRSAAPGAEIVPADDLLLRVQAIKTEAEIPYIVEAYRITEEGDEGRHEGGEAGEAGVGAGGGGPTEDARARAPKAPPYPVWVCSGPTSTLSLCRSTDRAIQRDELVQLSIGAKYMGYCGNMCRPFVIGKAPARRAQAHGGGAGGGALRPGRHPPGETRRATSSRDTTTSWPATGTRSSPSTVPRTARGTRRWRGCGWRTRPISPSSRTCFSTSTSGSPTAPTGCATRTGSS